MEKMSQTEFAKRRGISKSMWNMVLSNKRNLCHKVAVKVARALSTPVVEWISHGESNYRRDVWDNYVKKFNGRGK